MSDSIGLRKQIEDMIEILKEHDCKENPEVRTCIIYYKFMLEFSIKLYKEENSTMRECTDVSSFVKCRDNIIRVLYCIKKINKHGQVEDKIITYDEDHVAIIRDAIKTCCYYTSDTLEYDTLLCFKELVSLKEEDDALFQACVDEILKTVVMPGRFTSTYNFVLHPGFQKKILGIRPGPSPNDKDGKFICKLRKAIKDFLNEYNIKYSFSDKERFERLTTECNKATTISDPISLAKGGRSSRRRNAYKTIRRNNKNKNKKQYKRKRHTKKYKKSHRRSRR